MEPFPPETDLNADPDATGTGHLWLFEHVEGLPLRFRLGEDGQLHFGDREGILREEMMPPAVRSAVRAVRTHFRRDTLRDATDDVTALTFYGVATCQHRVEYDWAQLPAFLGTAVHTEERGYLLADATEQTFERLGLSPLPTLQRELRADAFVPERYTFPSSEWADSPVAGVLLADKHGWRGRLDNEIEVGSRPTFDSPEDAAAALVTEAAVEAAEGTDRVAVVRDRLAREHRADLAASGIDPSERTFRSAVAAEIQRYR